MESIWPYLSFSLGVIFALFLQWISYRLSFRKDQRREYWIRKLNSYQDFYQHTMQLIGLLHVCSDKELIISTIGAFVYYKNDYFTW